MRAYRLAKAARAAEAFNGEGARVYGGRWNRAGTPMVYAAENRALAALEVLVHVGAAERHLQFVVFEIDIPDALTLTLAPAGLPADWQSPAPAASTQAIGSAWQKAGKSAALRVPSVLVPGEHCVLLNPVHPGTRKIIVNFPTVFTFDGRL